ncbi:MAG: hydrogenase, partial [Candidatus Bathyarchaeia archaeon]
LRYMMERRADYGRVQLLCGAVTPGKLIFRDEYERWREAGVEVHVTVDRGTGGWEGNVGLVTWLFNDQPAPGLVKVEIPSDAEVFVCGPPAMIHFCCLDLVKLGFKPEEIYVSLEGHMKCGVGKCGHCSIGPRYVCRDGPIFSYAQKRLLEGYRTTR